MHRKPNDDGRDALAPGSPRRQGERENSRADPVRPDDERDGDGQARDQGDQTEDNKKQQE